MSDVYEPQVSIIFTIRMWQEANHAGQQEWRGAVKNLLSGEVRYFREWAALATLLPRMLEESPPDDVDTSSTVGDAGEIKEVVERKDDDLLKGGGGATELSKD